MTAHVRLLLIANAVAGNTDPGAAIHHWLFSAQGKTLRLRFLTTFSGNTKPLFFTASLREDNRFVFVSAQRDDLTVCITPGREAIDIRVFLRGNPHVQIKLLRAASSAR